VNDYALPAAIAAAAHGRYEILDSGPICTGRAGDSMVVIRPETWTIGDTLILGVDRGIHTPAGWRFYEGNAGMFTYIRVASVDDVDPLIEFPAVVGRYDVEVRGQIVRSRVHARRVSGHRGR
jgi:hypothetical protein